MSLFYSVQDDWKTRLISMIQFCEQNQFDLIECFVFDNDFIEPKESDFYSDDLDEIIPDPCSPAWLLVRDFLRQLNAELGHDFYSLSPARWSDQDGGGWWVSVLLGDATTTTFERALPGALYL